jgi:DNA polymerase-3 subunit alpha
VTGSLKSLQVGLHVHSEGSHLDGFATVDDIVKRVTQINQQAAAITDHGECNKHYAFQKACRAEGIKPIFGMEGYWHHDIAAARDRKKYPKDLSHICFLAKTQKGLSNLWALSSTAYDAKHFYHRPMADPALMREYAEGLYASDGCLMTQFAAAIMAGDEDRARQEIALLVDIFRDNFYIELHTWQYMDPKLDDEIEFFGTKMTTTAANQLMTDVNQAKLRIANEMGIPFVVVNDAHHAFAEDWAKKDMVNRIAKDKGDQLAGGQKADHIMADEELYYWMARHSMSTAVIEEAIRNSWDIAESCNAEVKPMLRLPSFTDSDHDDLAKFIDEVEAGFKRKVIDAGKDPELYMRRVETEMELIAARRFAGYFLFVQDYVGAAKDGSWKTYLTGKEADRHPMRVGAGRGSAGGALVSYLMGITSVDPIKYDLLFERFMTPSRKGFPDIDVDFPQSNLRGMAHYMGARHGHDCVCALGTVSRNGPKGMLRDLSAAYDVPWDDRKAMAALIEEAAKVVAAEKVAADEQTGQEDIDNELSWEEVLSEKGGELTPYVKKYPEMFDLLGQLVGIERGTGKHASGWLINDGSLMGVIPLRTRNHGKADEVVTTQFDMWEIEELGGVKFDLLGLRHLDTLDMAAKLVEQRHGVALDFEAFDAEIADPEIWEPVGQGHTVGLFQIETPGATRTAIDLKPRNEHDVAALISIIRPGVKDAGETERFLRRRAGLEAVVYDHPLMEPIVSDTYGILVYQEQMIRAARDLAGFTADEADDLRKVTAKKLADKIAPFEAKFREGCMANPQFMELAGSPKAAEKAIAKIWASINASARYSFNKSHAVGYGLTPCFEAWLSKHYPDEMLVSLMATDDENINRYVREARRRGIAILPPDINKSEAKFAITDEGIRYGISTLKGIGAAAATDIMRKRPYSSAADFFARTKANKGQIINLIRIGALDSLEHNPAWDGNWAPSCRTRLLNQFYDHYVLTKHTAEGKVAKMDAQQRAEHCAAWFAKHQSDESFTKDFPQFDFSTPEAIYAIEQELVGSFVTIDPMAPYLAALEQVAIKDPADVQEFTKGDVFVVGGQISKVKVITIKKGRSKGQEMAFLGVDYNEQTFDITVFSDTWQGAKNLLTEGAPVACTVIRDDRGCHLASLERLDLLWKAVS